MMQSLVCLISAPDPLRFVQTIMPSFSWENDMRMPFIPFIVVYYRLFSFLSISVLLEEWGMKEQNRDLRGGPNEMTRETIWVTLVRPTKYAWWDCRETIILAQADDIEVVHKMWGLLYQSVCNPFFKCCPFSSQCSLLPSHFPFDDSAVDLWSIPFRFT